MYIILGLILIGIGIFITDQSPNIGSPLDFGCISGLIGLFGVAMFIVGFGMAIYGVFS